MNKYILYILLFVSFSLSGQDVSFVLEAPSQVREGSRFQISFVLNAKPDKIDFPRIKGLQKIGGPYESSSSSTQYINGRWSHSTKKSYTFQFYAEKVGNYTIGKATVVIGGKEYYTEPKTIEVIKSNSTQPSRSSARQRQNTQHQQGQDVNPSENIKESVFIRPVVSKSNVYLGEQFILTYKLYLSLNVSSVDNQELNTFSGFWSKNLNDNQQIKQYEEIYEGKEYAVAELAKFALFPQKTGKIKIPAKKVPLTVQVTRKRSRQQRGRGSFFDQFFNNQFYYDNVDIDVMAPAITINVKPEPTKKKPASYSGAVGNFTMQTEIDKETAKANDAITLKITVKGRGNIELFDGPKLDFPPDFEIYDPKIEQRINTSEYGVSGTKTFEYLIIPRSAGDYEIPSSEFSYFNPNKKKYFTLKTPHFNLKIEKSDKDEDYTTYQGNTSKKQIRELNSDIYYIKTAIPSFEKEKQYLWGSLWFYFFLFFPIAAFILFTAIMKKELKKRGNTNLIRTKKATKVARNRLKKAGILMKENKREGFYVETSEALWGYLSDKFGIPLSQLSMNSIEEKLAENEVSENLIQRFTDLLNHCEFSKYAPAESDKDMGFVYEEAIQLISDMERELR